MTKYLYLLLILLCIACCSKKAFGTTLDKYPTSDAYTINKIKKQHNNVYFIYAVRNDSIFKIVSHYNGYISNNEVKLKKGMAFYATLKPYFNGNICGIQTMGQLGLAMEYYGVYVGQEAQNTINEIYFSNDINGRYIDISKVYINHQNKQSCYPKDIERIDSNLYIKLYGDSVKSSFHYMSSIESPLFEYMGVVRKMHSNVNVCDSLLSVYIEEKVQDLASKGFEGRFLIRAKLTIGKNGKVKKAVILDKDKEMRKMYLEVSDALKEVMFKSCLKNSSPKKTSIITLLIIDTYQYPSNISKMIFED